MSNRVLLLIGLFVCFMIKLQAQSQPKTGCEEKMVDETDSIQGTFSRSFVNKLIIANATDNLTFDLKQFNDALVVSTLVTGAGDCLDENSKMVVKFVSGATITLPMDGKFNCDREYAAFFGGPFGKKKEFRMMLTQEIESIRVETRKSVIDKTRKNFVEVIFTADQQKEFMQRLECLVGE